MYLSELKHFFSSFISHQIAFVVLDSSNHDKVILVIDENEFTYKHKGEIQKDSTCIGIAAIHTRMNPSGQQQISSIELNNSIITTASVTVLEALVCLRHKVVDLAVVEPNFNKNFVYSA